MIQMNKYESQIASLVYQCNSAMKLIDKKAYAFLEWIPYQYLTFSAESAFEREVINTYQLLGECGKYIWHNNKYSSKLKKYGLMIDDYKLNFYDSLRGMRMFYCHRYETNNIEHFEMLCKFLNVDVDDYDDDIKENKRILIKKEDEFWEFARKKLFDATNEFLNKYLQCLKTIEKSEYNTFKEALRIAIATAYHNEDRNFITLKLKQWLEAEIEILSGYDKSAAQTLLNNKNKIDGAVETIMIIGNIHDALKSPSLSDYTIVNVFEEVMKLKYDKRNGNFNK